MAVTLAPEDDAVLVVLFDPCVLLAALMLVLGAVALPFEVLVALFEVDVAFVLPAVDVPFWPSRHAGCKVDTVVPLPFVAFVIAPGAVLFC